MQQLSRQARIGAAALMMGALAACGGGGGSTPPPPPPPAVTVSVSADSIAFQGFTQFGAQSSPQTVTLTITSGTGPFYANIIPDDSSNFYTPEFSSASADSGMWTIQTVPGQANVVDGSFLLQLCSDAYCQHVVWYQSLPYHIRQFAIDPTPIHLSTVAGATNAPLPLGVTPADTTGALALATTQDVSSPTWLSAQRNGDGTLQVTADTAALPPQSLTGHVLVSFVGLTNGPSVSVPVTVDLGTAFVTPTPPVHTLDVNTPAVQAGTLPIAFQDGLAPAWTASSDQAWLTVVDTAGTGASTLHYSIDGRATTSDNWAPHVAHITVHAAGQSDLVVPVTLNRSLPEVYQVSPSVVTCNQGAHVHVFGRGFSQLPSGGGFVVSGGVTPTQTQVVSDHEAWLDVTWPATGRSMVSTPNAANVVTARAAVAAVDPASAPAAAFVANAGLKSAPVLDESRGAVFVANLESGMVLRFKRDAAGAWQTRSVSVPQPAQIGLSPDGRTLYVGTYGAGLVTVDPDTMATVASYFPPDSLGASLAPPYMSSQSIPFTNDGNAWFSTGPTWGGPVSFNLASQQFAAFPVGAMMYQPAPFATPDGSRLYLLEWGISPAQPIHVFRSRGDGSLEALADQVSDIEVPHFDATGTLVVSSQLGLYDDQGDAVGHLTGSNWMNPVPSPDGQRVFQIPYLPAGAFACGGHVDVYDTSGVQVNGPPLSPFAQVPYQADADSCGYATPWSSSLLVDAAGRTVYWVGDQGLTVIPVPDTVRPQAASRRAASTAPHRVLPAAGVKAAPPRR